MRSFFFDTYAFYEIIVGNPNYRVYTEDVKIFTTQLNLMELYYQLLLIFTKKDAMKFFERYQEYIIPISNSIIIDSMDFRRLHKKKKLSYVDCIGYVIAKKMDIRFLTGDNQFKDMENVEFVK